MEKAPLGPPPSCRKVLDDEGRKKVAEMASHLSPQEVSDYIEGLLVTLNGDASFVLKVIQNAHRKWVDGGMRADPIRYIGGAVRSHMIEMSGRASSKPAHKNPATQHIEGYANELLGGIDDPLPDIPPARTIIDGEG